MIRCAQDDRDWKLHSGWQGLEIALGVTPDRNGAYSIIGEQQGFWTGFGSINSTRVKLGS